MNPVSTYLAEQLQATLAKRRVVVFYDPRLEFLHFFDHDVEEVGAAAEGLANVQLGDEFVLLGRFDGSFFGLRAAVEPIVAEDEPDNLIVYVPGVEPDRTSSVLMELEKAGSRYEPQLKRIARTVLREFHTDGAIDEMLAPDSVTYIDIVRYAEQGASGEHASILKSILGSASSESLLVKWLAGESYDATIVEKGALEELYQLIGVRVGLVLSADSAVSEARGKAARYILVNEFRSDYEGNPPESLSMVPNVSSKDQLARSVEIATDLRRQYPDEYEGIADRVQADLNLASSGVDPSCLGSTDTFRFEERVLLGRAIELTAEKDHSHALEIVVARSESFWLDRDLSRRAQWKACQFAAELGRAVERVSEELDVPKSDPGDWVREYSEAGRWFEADQLQRRLETWVAQMDDEPECERAIGVVRNEHHELLKRMATGFSESLVGGDWIVPDLLSQTQIYPLVEEALGPPTAYFLVDAMRFEMGVELVDQLGNVEQLKLQPAIASLPTITPVGMAALLPQASGGFSVVESKGKLSVRVGEANVPDLPARLKYFRSKVPDLLDITLPQLLQDSAASLANRIHDSSLILVRSQEIDLGGEADNELFARHVMETCIANIARAVRKLASAGVESFVITADHGHQFSRRKEEDMRTDSPGGDIVALHRRAWVGRGGANPPGTVRVSGTELGYDTDLDFVFPTGLGVFKSGGGLTYHHGGTSLQELVIPVVTFRIPGIAEPEPSSEVVELIGVPSELTNRTFGVRVSIVGSVLTTESLALRVVLIAGDQQVGQAGMAVGAQLDQDSGIVTMEPGTEASLGIMLTVEDSDSVRLVVQDALTDAVLAQSEEIPVRLDI